MEVFQQLDRLNAPPEEKHRFISVERAQTDERVDRGGPRYSVSVRRVLASRYRSHKDCGPRRYPALASPSKLSKVCGSPKSRLSN
jgi:hypothetical protein